MVLLSTVHGFSGLAAVDQIVNFFPSNQFELLDPSRQHYIPSTHPCPLSFTDTIFVHKDGSSSTYHHYDQHVLDDRSTSYHQR